MYSKKKYEKKASGKWFFAEVFVGSVILIVLSIGAVLTYALKTLFVNSKKSFKKNKV